MKDDGVEKRGVFVALDDFFVGGMDEGEQGDERFNELD